MSKKYTMFSAMDSSEALIHHTGPLTRVDATADIRILSSYMAFDPERNQRPSLMIQAKLCGDIDVNDYHGEHVTLQIPDDENGELVQFDYNFSNEEIAQLAIKNYFTKNYELPDILTSGSGVTKMPVELRLGDVVGKATPDDEQRRIFVGLLESQYIETDHEKSDCDIVSFFEHVDAEDDYDYTDSYAYEDEPEQDVEVEAEDVKEATDDYMLLTAEERALIQRLRTNENARRIDVANTNHADVEPAPVEYEDNVAMQNESDGYATGYEAPEIQPAEDTAESYESTYSEESSEVALADPDANDFGSEDNTYADGYDDSGDESEIESDIVADDDDIESDEISEESESIDGGEYAYSSDDALDFTSDDEDYEL